MLIVIDEAGQLELQWLPVAVSTLAGLGVILVTCWQSRSQIADLYRTLADTVLTGHRSKVFFSGLDDPTSVDYLARAAGTEHIPQRGWSAEVRGGPRPVSEHPQRQELVPPHLARQIHPQEAVLLHGTLPPVHLRAVRWWEDPTLRRLVPVGDDGRPVPPDDIATCPLTDEPAPPPSPVIGPKTPRDAEDQIPDAGQSLTATGDGGDDATSQMPPPKVAGRAAKRSTPIPGQRRLLEPNDDGIDSVERNRVAGACSRCGQWLRVGDGRILTWGRKQTMTCHPECDPTTL